MGAIQKIGGKNANPEGNTLPESPLAVRAVAPWSVYEFDRRVVKDADGFVVADVRDWCDPANARLIAAAPDLLAALRLVVSRATILDPFTEAQIHLAIAKAEGR